MNVRRAVAALFGAAALAAPALARAQAITAGLGGNPSALVGDSLDVPVVVDMTARTDRLGSFALRLAWNPAVLRFEAGLSGSFGSVTPNMDSAAQGVIRLAGANPAGAGGLVTLGIGRFVVLTADTTTLAVSFSQLYAAATFADLLPSLTKVNAPFCAAQGRYGDINGDGAVNSGDALVALSAAVGLSVGPYDVALGDVSGDAVTDTRDVLIILSAAVGIDVSAFPRLGQILGGACATGATVTLAVTPAAAAGVLVGQEVTFEARATGPTGALVTIPNVAFRSSDTTVLAFEGGVDPATALARAAGSVTVTAVRDAHDSAQTPVTVVARRGTHWVDAKAATATNQLGTQTLPFATIAAALALAHGGDTIRPQPGRYPEELQLDSSLVLMGDTLADGSRPVLTGMGTGISMFTGGPQEVHNLAFDGFATAVDIEGATHVLLRGVVATNVDYGVFADSPIGGLWILESRLAGRGSSSYNSSEAVELYGTVDTLVIRGTEISDFYYDGVYAGSVDSAAIGGSLFHDLGGTAIDVGGGEGTLGFALDSTIVTRVGGTVSLRNVRSAAVSHVSLSSSGGEGGAGMSVSGASGGGWVRLRGDSADQPGYYWLNASGLDSVVVDSVRIALPYGSGSLTDVGLVRVTNSRFVNVSGMPLYVAYYSRAGGRVALDNVSVTGDPRCDLCTSAIYVFGGALVANRVMGVNLSTALWVSGDSSLSVTSSAFSHVGAAIAFIADSGASARLAVAHTSFSGFGSGIMASGGTAIAVDSNTFEHSTDQAVMVGLPEGSVRITGNRFTGVASAINVAPAHTVAVAITGNTATDLSLYGIIGGGGADTTNAAYRIAGNQVMCNAAGATAAYGIEVEQAHSVIQDNWVGGCYSGIRTSTGGGGTAPVRMDSIVGNTVTVPAGAYGGIYVEGPVRAAVTGNVVTADTAGYSAYGDIYVSGDSTLELVTARVDSNVVTGGSHYGVYVTNVDSVAIRFNTVEGVAQAGYPGSYSYGGGLMIESPVRVAGRIYGNLVRRIEGLGIAAGNLDTATIVVDSNLVSATPADTSRSNVGIMVGVYPQGGPLWVRKNRVTGIAGLYSNGIFLYWADPSRTVVDSNNIVGNSYGMYASQNGTFQALNNWWGDPAGPTCDTCTGPGDKVAPNINANPWLAAPAPSGLPLTAPIGHAAPVASTVPVSASVRAAAPAGAPVTGGIAVMGRVAVRGAFPAARPTPPAPSSARATAQQAARRRAAMAAARERDLATSVSTFAARAPRWTERIQALARAVAERDSARAVRLARQVAAQRALQAQAPQTRRP